MHVVVVEPRTALYGYLAVARSKGYEPLVLTSDASACRQGETHHNVETGKLRAAYLSEIIECDVTSPSAIIGTLERYRGRIAGMVPGTDTCVTPTFEAANMLGFDCARPEDARCQHVKTAMKTRLVEYGVPTPPFYRAKTLAEAQTAWRTFDEDCIVKMIDYHSSANVYRVTTQAELEQAWDAITMNRLSIESPLPLAKEAIVERYTNGHEVTVEGYEAKGRIEVLNFSEKVTSERFIVVDHFVPAQLSPSEQDAVEEVARACVKALGIRNSVFHVEMHIRNGKPYVIECAARPPGNVQVLDAIRWACGANLLDISIALSIGEPVTTHYREPTGHFAILQIYSNEAGRVTGLTGLLELRRKGGIRHWHLTAKLGDRVEALTDFRRQYGSLTLEDDTAEGVRALAEWARENVRLLVTSTEPAGSSGVLTAGMPKDA